MQRSRQPHSATNVTLLGHPTWRTTFVSRDQATTSGWPIRASWATPAERSRKGKLCRHSDDGSRRHSQAFRARDQRPRTSCVVSRTLSGISGASSSAAECRGGHATSITLHEWSFPVSLQFRASIRWVCVGPLLMHRLRRGFQLLLED